MNNFKISKFRTVRALEGASDDIFVGVPMYGDSLKHLGIFHNDILIVKMTKNFNEENLYVWNTSDGKTAKFSTQTLAEITLHNRADWRRTYFRADVEIFGAVIRVERDWIIKR